MKKFQNRWLTMALSTLLGFRGKAPVKAEPEPERYVGGYNQTRECARRVRQRERGIIE